MSLALLQKQDLRPKSMRIVGLVLLIALSGVADAQQLSSVELDKVPKSVYFKTNLLSLISGTFPLYTGELKGITEIVISEKATYNLGASLIYKSFLIPQLISFPLSLSPENTFWGYRFQGEFRYYYLKLTRQQKLSKLMVPSGLYVSAHGSYATANFRDKGIRFPYVEMIQVETNVLFGFQGVVSDAFGLDIFMGIGYKDYEINQITGGNSVEISPDKIGYLPTYGWPVKFKLGSSLVFGLF